MSNGDMDIRFTMYADTPAQAVAAIRAEVERRRKATLVSAAAALTQRKAARVAGELAALESVVWFLDRIHHEPVLDEQHDLVMSEVIKTGD